MRRAALVLAGVVINLGTPVQATDWAAAVVGLDKAVARIELQYADESTGICSGVFLNADSGHVLTAAHCLPKDGKPVSIAVNGRHAEMVRMNAVLDLAVVRTDPKGARALPLAAKAPAIGSDVAVLGFAWGAKRLLMQFGHVSLPLDEDGWLIIDGVAIGGDSGGPTINAQGELVGMTSGVRYGMQGAAHLAVMVPAEKIREFAEIYLPKLKP